jgi:hypothetical protein
MAACAVFYEDGLLLTFRIAIFISVTTKYVFELCHILKGFLRDWDYNFVKRESIILFNVLSFVVSHLFILLTLNRYLQFYNVEFFNAKLPFHKLLAISSILNLYQPKSNTASP